MWTASSTPQPTVQEHLYEVHHKACLPPFGPGAVSSPALRSQHLQALVEGVEQLRPALLGILLLEGPRLGGLLRKLGVVLPQLHQELVRHNGGSAVLQLPEQAFGCRLYSNLGLIAGM